MKKLIFILFLALSISLTWGQAPRRVPATPYPIEYVQPNGDTIMIRLLGDENYHFNTTLDGYLIVQDDKGTFRFAKRTSKGIVKAGLFKARGAEERKGYFLKRHLKQMLKDPKLKYTL